MKQLAAMVLAYIFLVFAVIGIFIPGLPTVPFLLPAAWCAARGSARLHRWLYSHPGFGKIRIDWHQLKAISRKRKITALLMLTASWVVLYRLSENTLLSGSVSVLFILVGLYIISRPEPG